MKFYVKDWTGTKKQVKKRGFATKREALEYERSYKARQEKQKRLKEVEKRKNELVKLTAEKYNLMQEYQKTKASVEESRKMVLERQINVRNGNERNNDTRHNQKQGDWIR